MRAELKSLESADALEGLDRFKPADPTTFALSIGATIGPAGGDGGDLFYFNIGTASWFANNPPPKGFEFLRHLLVTPLGLRASSPHHLRPLPPHTEGRDWNEIATKLSRHSHWEFEDHRETQ